VSEKVALFAFNGESMCFMHALLNAVDLHEKRFEVKLVIEGAATQLIPEMAKPENPLFKLYEKAMGQGLIEGACRACCAKMGTLHAAQSQGIRLLDDMSGHPSMSAYLIQQYKIITF
jgi:hypothetical protein